MNWTKTILALAGFILLVGYLWALRPSPFPRAHTDLEVAAFQPGPALIPGRQYWVDLPDGRHILINFKGQVTHAYQLPKQPAGGANNAMYLETATGNSWIWTVPAGASNIPQWIDP